MASESNPFAGNRSFVQDTDLVRSTEGDGLWVFTSDLRRGASIQSRATSAQDLESRRTLGGLSATRTPDSLGARSVAEDAANATSADTPGPVKLRLNPNNVDWDQGKRYTRQDTMGGTDWHHFGDKRGRNNDVLTLSFTGNTGTIIARSPESIYKEENEQAFANLQAWHNLYNLTRETMYLESSRLPNRFYIYYTTALFPQVITFGGFWSAVLKFSESGAKPRSRNYSMQFTVETSEPDLSDVIKGLNIQLI